MFKDDYRMEQPYMYHIGLSYDEERKDYFWEQPYGKKVSIEASDFRKWNKGSPNNEMGACVIAAQASSSFDLGWQSVDCSKKAIRYMCQTESCDTDSYCENVE
ncbi:hypothetical protein OESDEN_04088 [Oesophagostomum dentatum]|uniref:C-type lectin domain-containing protein n=1 Tax=Oesophagostomum dentatum TaxID=61180 RepID=A0A0B1TFB4_OESDE|nr:hypothetical protein OESDEN_04087 [Oesophagostomum dentatum]KHJ95955.1 hypothetical protein OESDEN_04088 [Oesophagostomum dentatum]